MKKQSNEETKDLVKDIFEDNIKDKRTRGEWFLSTTLDGFTDIVVSIKNPTSKGDLQTTKTLFKSMGLKDESRANSEFVLKAYNEYESLIKAFRDLQVDFDFSQTIKESAIKRVEILDNANRELLEALKDITDQFEKVVEPKYTLDEMLIRHAKEAIKKHSPIN